MPHKDPERRREFDRERARYRRARVKSTTVDNQLRVDAADAGEMSESSAILEGGSTVASAPPPSRAPGTDDPQHVPPVRPGESARADRPPRPPESAPLTAWERQERAWCRERGIPPPTRESERGGAPPMVPHCRECGHLIVACTCAQRNDELADRRIRQANEAARADLFPPKYDATPWAPPSARPTRPGPHLLPLTRPIYGPPEPERTEYTEHEKRPFT